jgi:hypothetical protein
MLMAPNRMHVMEDRMTNQTRLTRVARLCMVAVASLAVAVPAFASPASAATRGQDTPAALAKAIGDCPDEYACLWVDPDFKGARWQGKNNNRTLPGSIDNKASSSFNNGLRCTAHFTTEPVYGGQVLAEGIGSYRQNLKLNARPGGGNWNDIISSLYWCSTG